METDKSNQALIHTKPRMMKKLIFICLALSAICIQVSATPQETDRLIMNGDTLRLQSFPLEEYLESLEIPRDSLLGSSGSLRTNNWKGYVATWEIIGDQLYLVEIQRDRNDHKVDLAQIFGDKYVDGRVFADWVNMNLYVQSGDSFGYVHGGFGGFLSHEMEIAVENGRVLSIKDYDTLTGGRDPEMIRIWDGRKIDIARATKALYNIILQNLRWEDWMKESMMVDVMYKINEDFSYSVRGTRDMNLESMRKDLDRNITELNGEERSEEGWREYLKEDIIRLEKRIREAEIFLKESQYLSYVETIASLLEPVKFETLIFHGRPRYDGHFLTFYFDAEERRIYRVNKWDRVE